MAELKLELIFPDKQFVKFMDEVTSISLFSQQGKSIDEKGLYSQEIFGIVGTEERMRRFAYIDLNVDILHPRLYDYIIELSSLYKRIMSGKTYAVWDDKEKDFKISDIANGDTGYDFFMKHLKEIKFKTTSSIQRQDKIDVIYKYIKKGKITNNKLLVLPAGLRDFNIEKDGKITEVEINDLYKTIISTSKMLNNMSDIDGSELIKFKLQEKIHDLYKHIITLLDGKKKLIQGEWASPAVEFKGRTVAIGTEDIIEDLRESEDLIDIAVAGLAMYVKCIDPLAKFLLKENFLKHIFRYENETAILLNRENLKPETINLSPSIIDKWMTNDGLDSIMNTLVDNEVKNEPVILGDYYLFPIVDMGDTIKKYNDINLIPESEQKYVRAITYGEIFYLSILDKILKLPGFLGRYPVTEQGSILPVMVDVFTSTNTREVNYEIHSLTGVTNKVIKKYPIQTEPWINGLKAPYVRTDALGLDFDGDQIHLTMLMTEESKEEIRELMETPSLYIDPLGNSILSTGDKVSENTFLFLTRG